MRESSWDFWECALLRTLSAQSISPLSHRRRPNRTGAGCPGKRRDGFHERRHFRQAPDTKKPPLASREAERTMDFKRDKDCTQVSFCLIPYSQFDLRWKRKNSPVSATRFLPGFASSLWTTPELCQNPPGSVKHESPYSLAQQCYVFVTNHDSLDWISAGRRTCLFKDDQAATACLGMTISRTPGCDLPTTPRLPCRKYLTGKKLPIRGM